MLGIFSALGTSVRFGTLVKLGSLDTLGAFGTLETPVRRIVSFTSFTFNISNGPSELKKIL